MIEKAVRVSIAVVGVVMPLAYGAVPVIEPPLEAAARRPGPPVGFVVHPHAGHADELAGISANAELSNVFLWRMKDLDRRIVDFGPPTEWLKAVYASGRAAYPILDTSVFHTSDPWRSRMTAAANQNLIGADGGVWHIGGPGGSMRQWSSLYSPLFRESVFQYVDQLVEWVKVNDGEHRIGGYVNGAEWFMPAMLDYSPLGFGLLRDWLRNEYGTLETLNHRWGSRFRDWGDVVPPRGTLLGDGYVGIRTVAFASPAIDCGWISPEIPVQPDGEYKVCVTARQEGVPEGLCAIQLACYDARKQLIIFSGDGQFYWLQEPKGRWGTISAICKVPANARAARLGLKLMGPGRAEFTNPSVRKWPQNEEKLPPACFSLNTGLQAWSLQQTAGNSRGQIVAAKDRSGTPVFILSVKAPPLPYEHTGVAWEDWVNFSYESMAQWLDACAAHIKEKDPERPVSSYIGTVFGLHCLGDFNMYWQRLDISLANTPNLDVNGIQMCIADHDFTYATCPIDVARKYGKPIYATDLVDFPYGLFSGFQAIYRGTLAAVQHGADGVFWYNWHEPRTDFTDYNFSTGLTKQEQERLVSDVRSAIEALRGFELKTNVAMLMPIMSYSLADQGGYKSDPLDPGGWYHLILDLGLVPDVLTPYELAKRGRGCLREYELVFLPDCPVLPEKANRILIDYAASGGAVVGAGRPPAEDLAGARLSDRLLDRASAGKGKVAWISDMIGRTYWGKVRRWRVAGNTPPVFMRLDHSREAESLRRHLRTRVSDLVESAGASLSARLDHPDGNVHLARYCRPGPDRPEDLVLFLVYTGKGRSRGVSVSLDAGTGWSQGEAWIDFDRKVTLSVEPDGKLNVPAFSHCCLVSLAT